MPWNQPLMKIIAKAMATLEVAQGISHQRHAQARQQQADGQEHLRIGAVGNGRHQELRDAVGQTRSSTDLTQLGLVVEARVDQALLGEVEVAPHEIVGSIAEEDAGKDLPAKTPVGRIDLVRGQQGLVCRRLEDANHEMSPEEKRKGKTTLMILKHVRQ